MGKIENSELGVNKDSVVLVEHKNIHLLTVD